MKPIVKWAGGKKRLYKHIVPMIPENFNNYVEPFFGGGAIFLAIPPWKKRFVNDINSELIGMYNVVKKNPKSLIRELKKFQKNDSKKFFYEMRDLDRESSFSKLNKTFLAARTIYINKTCYGGIFRVNSSGYFNVPYAENINGKEILNEKNLMEWSCLLKKTTLKNLDFEKFTLACVRKNDFVFLDPPYIGWSKTANFVSYTKNGFTSNDNARLLSLMKKLNKKGVKFLMTNNFVPAVIEIFGEFKIKKFPVVRTVSSNGKTKSGYEECIITNY